MKKNIKILFFGILVFVNVGCVSKVVPIGDTGFKIVQDIKELNGCYENLGRSGNKWKSELSSFLWADTKIKHTKIKTICVSDIDENTISIVGKSTKNKNIYVQKYIKGKDFRIESGTITVKSKVGIVNDNMAGPTYESVVIGLDKEGNGRVISGVSFVGIALLIPVVMHENRVYRFLRIK